MPIPAGSTKVARVSTKPAVKPEIKQNKDFGDDMMEKVDVNLVFLRRGRNFIVIVMDIALSSSLWYIYSTFSYLYYESSTECSNLWFLRNTTATLFWL